MEQRKPDKPWDPRLEALRAIRKIWERVYDVG